ncbi:hypothetical protein DL766_004969 [Monosporascus sp. MC13-8B]|uniref:FAD-binding PCMH-type domain-containing protein n=1 Tax=Monosporascus cannonballus TaxID=155416 RepID=A0ABY0H3I3_9PEZI|nr:hypothetical protein DL762_006096 [Monosporascus cannonballus]RYO87994.1 hypothetical protein DL763_006146 [Monosporascus cannonballus]RYP30235.1 hypothetical protein DL766_004969 [Monosporascus sp. MC13-8B]
MLSRVTLTIWAALAWITVAIPTWQASSGKDLVQLLEKRAAKPSLSLNFTISSSASISYPGSPSWEADTYRWSDWNPPLFGVAFLPATEQDVKTGLQYLAEHNITFLATSGGHGSTITLASVHDGVAINLTNFRNVTFNGAEQTISVGAGAHFHDIWTTAYAAGRELPLSSACVGVGGTTVGGGHGWLQGKYGLVIDAIVSMRVALWNGTIINASATENSDLFWAMRGAGHNFGILLEFTLKTWPQTNGGRVYNADMAFTDQSLEGVVRVLNDIIPTQPAELGMDFVMFTNATTNSTQLFIGLAYFGDSAEGEKFTARFASSTETAIERTFLNETMVRWDQFSDVAVGGFIDVACGSESSSEIDADQLKVNVYTANAKLFDIPLTREVYSAYVDFVRDNPLAARSTVLYEIFAQQAMRAQNASETAYPNRNHADILVLFQGIFTDSNVSAAVDEWGKKWRDQTTQHSGFPKQHVYVNYAHGDEPLQSMYGYEPWRLERLRNLKAKYDPRGLFNHFNSVLGAVA